MGDKLQRMLNRDRARRRAEQEAEDARKAEVRARIERLFGEDGLPGWEMPRYFVLDVGHVKHLRKRNNVDAPTHYGALIDDLTTTALFLYSRLEELERHG